MGVKAQGTSRFPKPTAVWFPAARFWLVMGVRPAHCTGFWGNFCRVFQRGQPAELIFQGSRADFHGLTFFQVAELEGAIRDADQAVDPEANGLHCPANFAVSAFAQGNR